MQAFDVQVNGAGVVGKSLALSLSRLGLSVALRSAAGTPAVAAGEAGAAAAATPARDDVRAYALNAASVGLLQRLKVWDALGTGATTSVHDMVVHGDSTAGRLEFSAWEQCVGELAVITDAGALESELDAALRFAPHVTRVDADVVATLVAHCEGRAAASVAGLDAGFERSDYGQRAIAARLVSTRPHRHVARQWFRSPDVLALLPFDRPEPERSYALVWSLPSDRADALLAMDAEGFTGELAAATAGEAGELVSARDAPPGRWRSAAWPPGAGRAGSCSATPPTSSIRSPARASISASPTSPPFRPRSPSASPGAAWATNGCCGGTYGGRAGPTWTMTGITDGLLRLFAEPSAPVRELRNNGMTLVNRIRRSSAG
jgi:2-polyprenyl-6-methoxyphenol hydroxylase-like FAD-dependent oxidoreductase